MCTRVLVIFCVVLGACQVSLPEGQILCGLDNECPDGWRCDEASDLCR